MITGTSTLAALTFVSREGTVLGEATDTSRMKSTELLECLNLAAVVRVVPAGLMKAEAV